MLRINGTLYLTPREYMAKHGYATIKSVYNAIKNGTLEGVIRSGYQWYIPIDSVIEDRRVTHGRYIGSSRRRRQRKIQLD